MPLGNKNINTIKDGTMGETIELWAMTIIISN